MSHAPPWLMLIVSLAGRNQTPRMRLWRALKAAGAKPLRDGVYVLPAGAKTAPLFQTQADEVTRAGGTAYVVPFAAADEEQHAGLRASFDRADNYAELLGNLASFATELRTGSEAEARRALSRLRREFDAITAIDYFPGAPRSQASAALDEAEAAINDQFAPDEPHAAAGEIVVRNAAAYRGRTWATRRRLWVDRVASAWLIRRFIDPDARFLWLAQPADCPADALGFDFDGAEFTHIGQRVSFEVLRASFSLDEDSGLQRLGQLVHYLDVGGLPVPDAAGFASYLSGARLRLGDDDDRLLQEVGTVLDSLYAAYSDPSPQAKES